MAPACASPTRPSRRSAGRSRGAPSAVEAAVLFTTAGVPVMTRLAHGRPPGARHPDRRRGGRAAGARPWPGACAWWRSTKPTGSSELRDAMARSRRSATGAPGRSGRLTPGNRNGRAGAGRATHAAWNISTRCTRICGRPTVSCGRPSPTSWPRYSAARGRYGGGRAVGEGQGAHRPGHRHHPRVRRLHRRPRPGRRPAGRHPRGGGRNDRRGHLHERRAGDGLGPACPGRLSRVRRLRSLRPLGARPAAGSGGGSSRWRGHRRRASTTLVSPA